MLTAIALLIDFCPTMTTVNINTNYFFLRTVLCDYSIFELWFSAIGIALISVWSMQCFVSYIKEVHCQMLKMTSASWYNYVGCTGWSYFTTLHPACTATSSICWALLALTIVDIFSDKHIIQRKGTVRNLHVDVSEIDLLYPLSYKNKSDFFTTTGNSINLRVSDQELFTIVRFVWCGIFDDLFLHHMLHFQGYS